MLFEIGLNDEEIHTAGMVGLNLQEARPVDGDIAEISNGTVEKVGNQTGTAAKPVTRIWRAFGATGLSNH